MAKAIAKRKSAAKKPAAKRAAPRLSIEVVLEAVVRMPAAELRQIVAAAEARIAEMSEGEKKSFIEETQRRALELGVSIRDLLGGAVRAIAPGKAKDAVPVKYRGTREGQEWSGRGRPPRWLVSAEAAGQTRDDFLVK